LLKKKHKHNKKDKAFLLVKGQYILICVWPICSYHLVFHCKANHFASELCHLCLFFLCCYAISHFVSKFFFSYFL
jgi:hypothetical protein